MNDLSVLLPGFWCVLPILWFAACALTAEVDDDHLAWLSAGLFPLLCAGAARLFP